MNEKDVLNEPKTYFQEVVEHISVKRKERLNNAVFGEIKQIAREHDIFTTVELNEQAIVQALEKQIPKKPDTKITNRGINISGEYDIDSDYICPICKCVVGECEIEEHWFEYCPVCGQALDWSDENG